MRLSSILEDNRFDIHHSDKYAGKCFAGFVKHRELVVGRHFELADPEHRQFTWSD
ncbi:hypothetical protein [Noviherbaspirillum sp.]|uniref:hypothetical protein n=1 Tax=Noviherbaspirillum sp. TaxID=1926288 RepID=UPI002FE3CDE3